MGGDARNKDFKGSAGALNQSPNRQPLFGLSAHFLAISGSLSLCETSAAKQRSMIPEDKVQKDRFLTEVERQRKYLNKLPKNFEFPLFNSKQALESQRRNGYRNSAAAAREIIDNAIEAGADSIHVVFERPARVKTHERQNSVSAVAFIDNGSGMLSEMARYALSWGGGTHFEEPEFIGRFGFGLPNASINQTRLVEVYTRTSGKQAFTKAWLDITNVSEHGIQTIPEPVESELPPFVERYLEEHEILLECGTVVVWVKPDRLTYRMAPSLREHFVDDFGVTYRYLLSDPERSTEIDLRVDGCAVEPVDPLFLDPRSRYYLPPEQGGAIPILGEPRIIPIRYSRDPETGEVRALKVQGKEEVDPNDSDLLAIGTMTVQLARFPIGFADGTKTGKGESRTDAHRRFEIRKSRRGMSFVRAGREIETVDSFPRSARDEASGLGDWPLLQSYAYHWGIEVKFDPSLDEVFGITNDKQTVRPIEDFWRILAKEEIDKAAKRENKWQTDNRDRKKPVAEPSATASAAEKSAAAADAVTGRKPSIPESRKQEAVEALEVEATRRAEIDGKTVEEVLEALEKESKRRPYRIDYFDDPSGPFYEPMWVGDQIVVRINRSHPFYWTLYGELLRLSGGVRAKEAVDVVLIALTRGELITNDETTKLWYETQRIEVWSQFLSKALKVLAETLRPEEDQTAPESAAPGGDTLLN